MYFQIFPAKCRWGQDKRPSGSLWFVLWQETSRSKSFFLSGVLRKIHYMFWCGPYSKFPSSSWHLAATNLHRNKTFTCLISLISIKLNFLFVLFALFDFSTLELAVIGTHLCPTSGWASPLQLEQDISSSSPELMLQKTRWGEMFFQNCREFCLPSFEPLLPANLLCRMPALPWRPFCSIVLWQLSVGCSSRESTFTCLLSRFTTSWTKCGYIKRFPGVRTIGKTLYYIVNNFQQLLR